MPARLIPYAYARRSLDVMRDEALAFYRKMNARRTIREFSPDPVPREVIEHCICTAGTAPSGAHQQPWYFVVVESAEIKRRIREAAEIEEREFYNGRAPAEWLATLEPLGTDSDKPFLETAPYLIVIFARAYGVDSDGTRRKHYYVQESVGIATGLLIAALHQAGLASLTHTPSPMGFLNELCGRPANERPFLILVTGYPSEQARVPDLHRRPFADLAEFR